MRKKNALQSGSNAVFWLPQFCTLNVDKIVSNASRIVKDR